MKGIYITVYVRTPAKLKELDAYAKALGVGRGKAIERLLEIAKERPGRTLRVSGGVKLPSQRDVSDVAIWAKGGGK